MAEQQRLTTGQMITDFRRSDPSSEPLPNFDHFEDRVARHLKCPKSLITRDQAIAYAMQ